MTRQPEVNRGEPTTNLTDRGSRSRLTIEDGLNDPTMWLSTEGDSGVKSSSYQEPTSLSWVRRNVTTPTHGRPPRKTVTGEGRGGGGGSNP